MRNTNNTGNQSLANTRRQSNTGKAFTKSLATFLGSFRQELKA
jgi:hypothetical protein